MKGIEYITDEKGDRKSIIIDLKKWGDLIEDLIDAIEAKERVGEESVPYRIAEGRKSSQKIEVMKYSVRIKKSALKELENLPEKSFEAIDKKILALELNPRPFGVKKLLGTSNVFRIRHQVYRIIYTIDEQNKVVEILHIKHRSRSYQ